MSSQSQLEFKVRKSLRPTRSSVKLNLTDSNDLDVRPKSPLKRTRSRRNCSQSENAVSSPAVVGKKGVGRENEMVQKPQFKVPLPLQQVRIPLSPRKDLSNYRTPTERPVLGAAALIMRSPFSNRPTPDQIRASPGKIRALSFNSPTKEDAVSTPEKNALKDRITKARALNFSPQKLSQVLSPKKVVTNDENCASPHKSPRKRLMIDDMCGSPCKSPRRHLLDDISGSPRKSPRKHLLSSPNKATRCLMSPMRIAKQEGLCYQKAKKALHTALPETIVGRQKEQETINNFLEGHLCKSKSGSLYISGAPGTGKTAILSLTLRRIRDECNYEAAYVNCMSLKNSQAIYNKVLGQIKGKETSLTTKEASKQLEKCFSSSGPMMVLILDEIDSLDSKSQEVLYTMFEWPSMPKSRLVLIGIANALDLTDRILPRLQARPKCRPELLHFSPYSKDQIVAVLTERLSQVEVGGEKVLDPSAIQFCARKVAAVAGDMRKALDVCRRAVEMVEADIRKQRILASPGSRSPSKKAVPKKITVAHILKIVNEVYGTRVVSQQGKQQTLPLQQKLAVCTLLLMLKTGKGKEVLLGKFHECFAKICTKQNVSKMDQSEFQSMLSLIDAHGILSIRRGKETRNSKVSLKLDERELEVALQDKTLITHILQGGIPK